jgi:Holliday junction resolvase-like predicted endonuclease
VTRTRRQAIGDTAESIVAERLLVAGWRILGRQVRVGRGELDIVAIDPGPPARLVAVEVRWRASRSFGVAEETFGAAKRRHVREALLRLVEGGRAPDGSALPRLPVGIDLVVVEPATSLHGPPVVRHHRDALGR